MSTTVEKISSNKVKLSFDIDAAKFDEAMGKAYIKVRGQVAIPGFRKGHAPRKMIENMYGEGVFYDEAFELIFDEVYGPAIDENKLEVVDRPQVDIQQIGTGKNLQFTCEVFVKPDVTLGEYKGVEVKKEHTLVTEDDVNAEIEKERNKQAAEVSVDDRAVAEGDTVNLDYSGSVDGVKFAGGTAEKQNLELGSNSFIPGFEEQIVGMKIGEERDINVKFPEDYHAEDLKGKDAVFHIKLHEIKKKELPEITDEFIKDADGAESVEAFKAETRKRMQEANDKRAERELEDKIVKAVTEKAETEIPDALVEHQIDNMVQEMEYRLMYQGLRLEDYLKYAKMSMEEYRKGYAEQAKELVKQQLVIEKIIAEEKIEASDEEVENKIRENAEAQNKSVEDYKKENAGRTDYVKNEIVIGKLFDFLKSANTIE